MFSRNKKVVKKKINTIISLRAKTSISATGYKINIGVKIDKIKIRSTSSFLEIYSIK